jgi:hypothetical protein
MWAPSLMRGWISSLQLLLGLDSAVILRSQSSGTRDHILLLKQMNVFSLAAKQLKGFLPCARALISTQHIQNNPSVVYN